MARNLVKLDLGSGLPIVEDVYLGDVETDSPEARTEQLRELFAFPSVFTDDPTDDGAPDEPDLVDHPPHYTAHPSGVECVEVTEHMTFCLGNAVKYIWRAGLKGDRVEDLKKARWYLDREIGRLQGVLYRQAVLGETP